MIEIRFGGIVFLDGEEVGRLNLFRSYLEAELVGFWYREGGDDLGEVLWGEE